MRSALEVSHFTRNYSFFKLDDMSFTVPGGITMDLIGGNGIDKSTTIKCILNLIRRDGGEIQMLGLNDLADEWAVKAQVGMVLGETTFHDGLSAPQVGGILACLYPGWDGALHQHCLEKFGLTNKKLVKTFPKGMEIELSLAVAFVIRPRLLILDEATSGLDPMAQNEILDELLALVQDEERATLLSNHITSGLERVANHMIYLHGGWMVASRAKDELLDTCDELMCNHSEPERMGPALLIGVRSGQFGREALVKDRRAFAQFYPEPAVEPVPLEDIMIFTIKGDVQ